MLKSIIIDDEPNGRDVLKNMLRDFFPDVQVLKLADNAAEGVRAIEAYHPDVVFLDVEMPGGNGFQVLEAFHEPNFKVIFTTAYSEYALKALKLSALDYLLKPINIEELKAALKKVKKLDSDKESKKLKLLEGHLNQAEGRYRQIALPTSDGYALVELNDIIRCESDRNYSRFFLTNKENILVAKSLGEYEELLQDAGFFRVHNSNLINLRYVKKYIRGKIGRVLMSDGTYVDVAARRKDDFLNAIRL